MYTAFLALPPLENQTGTKAGTIPETDPLFPAFSSDLSSAAAHQVNHAVTKLNKTLLTDDTVRYVVVPAMVGGLGSVALQMIQEGGTFMAKSVAVGKPVEQRDPAPAQTGQGAENTQTAAPAPGTDGNEQTAPAQTHKVSTEQAVAHDFVPSIRVHAGLEFLILVASSVLLGTVVGFMGAVLSLDGPPKEANNKSKLAATALMFALFFPSVITVFQENAISQAELIQADKVNSDLKDQVQEKTQQAENLEEVARKEIIEETAADPVSTINNTHSLVLNATSEQKAKDAISSIFTIGNSDDGDVRDSALRVLTEIEENPALSEAVQQAAVEQLEKLSDTGSGDLVEEQ